MGSFQMSGAVKATINFQSPDQSSNQQQSVLNSTISKLTSNPLSGGSLLDPVKVSSGSNAISHKLPSKPRGYIVVGQDAPASFYQVSADTKILTLNASAACTVTLFVF